MARKNGTTTQRGYGAAHQSERERRLRAYKPGDTCAHGGEPLMFWPLSVARRYLDLPHTDDRSGYLPGLSCRRHNRQDGQRKTTAINRARGTLTPRQLTAIRLRQWASATAGSAATAKAPSRQRRR